MGIRGRWWDAVPAFVDAGCVCRGGDMLLLYVSMAWDLMPLLSSSCSSYTLQGKEG
jgi:hypothetical protein